MIKLHDCCPEDQLSHKVTGGMGRPQRHTQVTSQGLKSQALLFELGDSGSDTSLFAKLSMKEMK